MDLKNNRYLILTIIFTILSIVGIILLFWIIKNKNIQIQQTDQIIPTIAITPTETPKIQMLPEATASSKIASSSSISAKKITITPTPTATPTAKPTPTLKPTIIPTIISPTSRPTTTPISPSINSTLIFSNQADAFSVTYSSNRQEYTDKETSGNRYTFTSSSGNFAVHVAPSGTWAWINSSRSFTPNLTVSGQNTFRYDISTQTIVDLQSSDKNYTIQCIHNGNTTLKAECETFIKSFTLL